MCVCVYIYIYIYIYNTNEIKNATLANVNKKIITSVFLFVTFRTSCHYYNGQILNVHLACKFFVSCLIDLPDKLFDSTNVVQLLQRTARK